MGLIEGINDYKHINPEVSAEYTIDSMKEGSYSYETKDNPVNTSQVIRYVYNSTTSPLELTGMRNFKILRIVLSNYAGTHNFALSLDNAPDIEGYVNVLVNTTQVFSTINGLVVDGDNLRINASGSSLNFAVWVYGIQT